MTEPAQAMETKTYSVRGMRCEACTETVRERLESLEGVDRAVVSLDDGVVRVTQRSDVALSDLNGALASTDYAVERFHEPADEPAPPKAPPTDGRREAHVEAEQKPMLIRLWPLVLIVAYLIVVPAVLAVLGGEWTIVSHMRHFMGGFFLAFSFFKLLDLRGFVGAFRGYDLVAAALPPYAWFYPFIELALGVLYLAEVMPLALNSVVLVLMLVGIAGVVRAILRPGHVRCACLGTVLDLPMTWVTFTENAAMAAMAGYMLYRSLVAGG